MSRLEGPNDLNGLPMNGLPLTGLQHTMHRIKPLPWQKHEIYDMSRMEGPNDFNGLPATQQRPKILPKTFDIALDQAQALSQHCKLVSGDIASNHDRTVTVSVDGEDEVVVIDGK